jgi:hypothetical protein
MKLVGMNITTLLDRQAQLAVVNATNRHYYNRIEGGNELVEVNVIILCD